LPPQRPPSYATSFTNGLLEVPPSEGRPEKKGLRTIQWVIERIDVSNLDQRHSLTVRSIVPTSNWNCPRANALSNSPDNPLGTPISRLALRPTPSARRADVRARAKHKNNRPKTMPLGSPLDTDAEHCPPNVVGQNWLTSSQSVRAIRGCRQIIFNPPVFRPGACSSYRPGSLGRGGLCCRGV
jgi:hypothetical protein